MPNNDSQSMMASARATGASPAWRKLEAEALARGFVKKDGSPNLRAFRRVLKRLGIAVYHLGSRREQAVCPEEIDALVRAIPSKLGRAVDDDIAADLAVERAGWR